MNDRELCLAFVSCFGKEQRELAEYNISQMSPEKLKEMVKLIEAARAATETALKAVSEYRDNRRFPSS